MKLISLTQGKFTKVDDEDYEVLSKFKWHFANGYARRHNGFGRICIGMQKHILSPKNGLQADHINGDTLDNRRENLRVCKPSENYKNRKLNSNNVSGFKGVRWHKNAKKWIVSIMNNGKQIHLGYFTNNLEASEAYKKAELHYYKDFARNLCQNT